mgnify:CR=1 FL=1
MRQEESWGKLVKTGLRLGLNPLWTDGRGASIIMRNLEKARPHDSGGPDFPVFGRFKRVGCIGRRERGTHEELLKTESGIYRELINAGETDHG